MNLQLHDIPATWAIVRTYIYFFFSLIFVAYLILVRSYRYARRDEIEAKFKSGGRELSTMTGEEAFEILTQLQELEFPYAFAKARQMALLKAGGIPSMSKLFAVTGQNNRRNAGRRAVDTEILLRESQTMPRDSERYAMAVARVNYLHERYRRAGKITDPDLLHTLGDGLAEILTVIERDEWRKLTDVEKCALGVFHKNLGEDLDIPFDPLSSSEEGWRNGVHFAMDIRDWTIEYEERVAVPNDPSAQYVHAYVDSAFLSMPKWVGATMRKTLGADLDDTMRSSLGLEAPGPLQSLFIQTVRNLRILYLRHLSLPRHTAVKALPVSPNPKTGKYNFERKGLQPWYMESTFWSSWGPTALLVRAAGGKVPGSKGDRYYPQGYDLMTIGPEPQKGKGIDEMKADIEAIRARGVATCPFSIAKLEGM
ncbi:unnamed protein product [Clonostachys rosea]|uniref:ER-bound oxygenase mpaB/mpaB'/Rubber oxygenase catalytic domain-containing protein n=1 Tax=Bionectria ochroleuca TaxID=29856 RepID=A0ABY6UJH1_BIOOC|nr:unnamed protein product [Clonostachys rosea]